MRAQGFSGEVEQMLADAGFEPCFVRDLNERDTIQIRRGADDATPAEMTITELFLPGAARRTGYGDAQWIGVFPDGRKVHCTYDVKHPAWRQPRAELTEESAEGARPSFFIKED